MEKVAIIGAGSWGSALSIVLADNGFEVALWARREQQAEEINTHHTNERYLPQVKLSQNIHASTNIAEVIARTAHIIVVLPTKAIGEVIRQMRPHIQADQLITHSSKGLDATTYQRISQIITEELASITYKGVVVLSGPSHAEEVCHYLPTTVVSSCQHMHLAQQTQELFMSKHFRVYTNTDIVGVELAAALKNIIALSAGLSDGLGYGDNAKAALITRGLAEISRLGITLGADPLTFAGLAGLGDLVVTCTSKHSRNWRMGYALGQGKTVGQALQAMNMVVEGIQTTKAAYHLSAKQGIEMPITRELYGVLFEEKCVHQAVHDLMGRGKRNEFPTLADF